MPSNIQSFEQHHPEIAKSAYIAPHALVIGQVKIAEDASVWPMTVVRGDINHIEIGARSNIQDGSVLHVVHAGEHTGAGYPLIIGADVTVGHKACLHACTIGHHCLVGMGAIVLDGAELEPYTLLAAGSLVSPRKKLEGGYLWRGSPAQKARPLSDKEKAYFDYSAAYYMALAQRHSSQIDKN